MGKDVIVASTLLQSNMSISGGSDSPVEPPDVLEGIQCAVTRLPVTREGKNPYRPEEALSVADALDLFTFRSAYASFEENVKGCIKAGQLADFTVLSQSPFEVPSDQIHAIAVQATFLGGKQVY